LLSYGRGVLKKTSSAGRGKKEGDDAPPSSNTCRPLRHTDEGRLKKEGKEKVLRRRSGEEEREENGAGLICGPSKYWGVTGKKRKGKRLLALPLREKGEKKKIQITSLSFVIGRAAQKGNDKEKKWSTVLVSADFSQGEGGEGKKCERQSTSTVLSIPEK